MAGRLGVGEPITDDRVEDFFLMDKGSIGVAVG